MAPCTTQGQTLVSCTVPNHWNLFFCFVLVSLSLLIGLVILQVLQHAQFVIELYIFMYSIKSYIETVLFLDFFGKSADPKITGELGEENRFPIARLAPVRLCPRKKV